MTVRIKAALVDLYHDIKESFEDFIVDYKRFGFFDSLITNYIELLKKLAARCRL